MSTLTKPKPVKVQMPFQGFNLPVLNDSDQNALVPGQVMSMAVLGRIGEELKLLRQENEDLKNDLQKSQKTIAKQSAEISKIQEKAMKPVD